MESLATSPSVLRLKRPSNTKDQACSETYKDLRLKLAHHLQSSLDVESILAIFFDKIQDAVNVSGIHYQHHEADIMMEQGEQYRNKAHYGISADDIKLGDITFSRDKHFAEAELVVLEMMIGILFYPLRNALLYREALQNSMRDPLTHIGNRTAMTNSFSREIRLAKRHQHPLTVLLIDIDHFKQVNDQVGHHVGDEVLKKVVTSIQTVLRDTDQVFRYGGEEFFVILNNTPIDAAKCVAERIRVNVANNPVPTDTHAIASTVSVGISELSADDNANSLFIRADKALYKAKNTGRNKIYHLT